MDEEFDAEGFAGIEYGVCELDKDKEIEKIFNECKPVLDYLYMKSREITDKDIQDFIKRIEEMIKRIDDKIGENKLDTGLSLWEVITNLGKGLIMKHPEAENATCSIDVCLNWIYKKLKEFEE